jgi:TPR repeat protein
LREASALGHGPAAFVVAQAYRDGRGGWPNAVEAYAFFDLAARRNVAPAASARDALFASFDAATRTRAQAQARQFPTVPPRPTQ